MKKVVLVTGASNGIGRAIAKELSKDFIVIANYNKSEEKAKDLQNEVKEQNNIRKQFLNNQLKNFTENKEVKSKCLDKDDNFPEFEIYKADVSKRESVKQMIEYIINKYGKIDILINNAGIDLVKIFTDVTDDEWNSVIDTNLYSVFCVTQEASKYMINQKYGNIINISSIFGIIGASCESIYSVSKAGIDGLTKSLAKELGPSNIRVNSIAPGIIDTKMNDNLSNEDIKEIEDEIPMGRIGKPEEIAKVVQMLINNEYITGQIIEVNGGWHI